MYHEYVIICNDISSFHCFLTILYDNKKKQLFTINRYLIHKRNSGHGDTITPWRVSSNQDNNYKTNVPINATLIGAVATIVPNVFLIYRFIESDTLFKVIHVVWLVASAVQMPLVLAFTIKNHKKTSKINPVVPRTLQFHEDEDDCNNCDDINNEASNDIMENDEHPKVTFVEVYKHVESTDNADENCDADDNCECLELTIRNKQIKLTEIGEAPSQLPGEACHM
jgi:hypothetical protein